MLRWLLLAIAVTLAMPVQVAAADTPPIVRLRKSKSPAKASPAAAKKAQANKMKRARMKRAAAKRTAKKSSKPKPKRDRDTVVKRPMP